MGTLWRLCTALGLAPLLRRGYLLAHGLANGWQHRASIGGVEAVFATRTWPEYKRVTTCFGERAVIAAVLDELDGDDVVWDVGANVGLYACFLASGLRTGRVVAVEPELRNAARLQANLRANAPTERWLTVPVALAAESGPGHLASEGDDAGPPTVGTGHHRLGRSEESLPVRRERGETLVAEGYPAPDVLKIDVQGAELRVLRGMGETLDGVRTVFLELHPDGCRRYGTSPAAVEEFLRAAGFDLERLGGADWIDKEVSYLRATRA